MYSEGYLYPLQQRFPLKYLARFLLPTALFLGTACAEPLSSNLTGTVLDDASGAGLANATITVAGSDAHATTDAAGHYTLKISGKPHTLALSIAATDHAPHRQYVQTPKAGYGHLQTRLRPFEFQQVFTLPEAGEAPLQVTVKHSTATMGLRIEAGDMVRADGTTAHGSVQVNVAFWHPLEDLSSAPGLMLAGDANMQRLKSWGMADMEVRQDGGVLQVASQQALEWTVQLPEDFAHVHAALPLHLQPNLYYLDPNNGLWRKDGSLAFDANQTLFTGTLPHLSGWNIDSLNEADGGCVQGRVMNKCGKPAANRAITVWFLDDSEVEDFPLTTDAAGAYCVNTGINPISLMATGFGAITDTTTHYRVSGGSDMADSSQCNPLPSECMACNEEPMCCNGCAYGMSYNDPLSPIACAPPMVYITGCNWCPGTCPSEEQMFLCAGAQGGPGCKNECEVLLDVVVSDPTCDKASNPNSALNPNSDAACKAGPKPEGAACNVQTSPCCNPQLVCNDYVCVPLVDGQ